MPSKYEFGDRSHVLKAETEKALRHPQWFARRMNAEHNRGDGPQPVEIRLKGNIGETLALAAHLCEALDMSADIKKLEIDRENRVGNYDAHNIFIYLKPDEAEVRDHDEIAERTLRLKRAACEKCRMIMSPREISRGKCGNCGAKVA
jgi:ribosomal protein S27AE